MKEALLARHTAASSGEGWQRLPLPHLHWASLLAQLGYTGYTAVVAGRSESKWMSQLSQQSKKCWNYKHCENHQNHFISSRWFGMIHDLSVLPLCDHKKLSR